MTVNNITDMSVGPTAGIIDQPRRVQRFDALR